MNPELLYRLPFLVREMLQFGSSRQFQLVVDVVAHTAGEPVEVRGYTKEGPFINRFVPVGDSSVETFSFNIADIPTGVSVCFGPGASSNSLAYASLYLAVDGDRLVMLTQGTIGVLFGVAWPHQLPQTNQQSEGAVVNVEGTAPAAGAEVAFTVPTGQVWELLGLGFELECSATVADRTVRLEIDRGDGLLVSRIAGTTQQASETQLYNFVPGGTSGVITANQSQEVGIPAGIFLVSGMDIRTVTTNIQVGDQFGTPNFLIRRNYRA